MTPREDMGADEAILDNLPEFPLSALPPALANYCQAAARSIDPDMPADAIALPALAAIGGLIGNRLALEVKPKVWVEYPSLYVAIIAESGTAKTAAMKMATWPVKTLEHKHDLIYETKVLEREQAVKDYKEVVRQAKASKNSPPPPPSLLTESELQRRRIVTTDTTTEAIVSNFKGTPGMVLLRDELSGWIGSFDAYRGGSGGDRAKWLEMWSSADITVDRKVDGTTKIYSPVMGVIGGIQPSLLPSIYPDPRLVDGFLERILFTAHRLQVPAWSDAEISAEILSDITEVVGALDLLPRRDLVPGEPIGIRTTFTRDAKILWKSWYDEVMEIGRAEMGGSMRSYYSKLRNQCARIIITNHAIWTAERDPTALVDSAAVEQGIAIAAYLQPHYAAFLGETQRQREVRHEPIVKTRGPDARPVPDRLLEKLDGAGGRITRSNLIRRLGRTNAADLDAIIEVLIADGTITEEIHGEGKRATRIYARARK